MSVTTAILLGLWSAFAVSVVTRLRRDAGAAFDDQMTPADRRLVGACAFYLVVPGVVILVQAAQVAALWMLGEQMGAAQSYIYWGWVSPADPGALTPLQRAEVAAIGPVGLAMVGLGYLAYVWRRPGNAAQNHLGLESGRLLLLLAFGVHPLLSLALGEGNFSTIRDALNERFPQSGDVALLGYGTLGAYVFFRWRGAARLRVLGTPMHDASQQALLRLAQHPGDTDALRELGRAQLAASDPRALATLEAAYRIRPNDPRTGLALGHAHLARGNAGAASEHLREAGLLVEDDGDEEGLLVEITLALGSARMALGDIEGALLTARAAGEVAPQDARGALLEADALVATGRREEARVRLETQLSSTRGKLRREIRRRLDKL